MLVVSVDMHKHVKEMREQATLGFGFTFDWLRKWSEVLNQSLSVVMEEQSRSELRSTFK